MKNKLEQNIYKDYIYNFLARFDLTHGVWMLYLAYKGLTLFEIGMMESVYHITAFTMEVPTGMIADLYGRKTSRICGRILSVLAIITMLLADRVWLFALSFVFTALGNNLESGAGEALIYDSLKELKREDEYMRISGIREIFFQLSSSISLILGGYLASIDYHLVYMVALAFAIMAAIQTFTFTEPDYGRVRKEKNGLETLINQLKRSIAILRNDRKIAFIIITIEVFSVYFTTEFFYVQNFMKAAGHSEFIIGITLAAGSLAGAFMASMIHRLDRIFKPVQLLKFFPIMAILGFWLMTFENLIAIAFVLLSIIEGAMFVLTGDYINRLIPSGQRATIISVQSMFFSILMIMLFPLMGRIGDLFSLTVSFRIIAVLATISLSFLLWILNSRSDSFQEL